MKILTIESQASNIPITKGIMYVVITVRPIKIFIEYVGTNMSIQVPLLVTVGYQVPAKPLRFELWGAHEDLLPTERRTPPRHDSKLER